MSATPQRQPAARPTPLRLTAACATAALAVTLAAVPASSAAPIPQGAPAGAALDGDLPQVTITPDPSYAGPEFEGWGTSLVWFANATGGYPDEIRETLADMVFGPDGLNLNIARYNAGGGNAPDVPDYLRAGAAVDGWWKAPEGTTREDVDWWDPTDPEHWDPDADATQRWWVDRIKDDVTHWELFSNSPPWFQTVSGYVSGGFSATTDQLRTDRIDDFAAYLVGVAERLEDAHGIEVATIDPFNEPNTNYWSTQLGVDGNPTGGRQEGAHMSPGLQAQVIPALADALDSASTDAVISAMDETNPGTFVANWNAYPPAVRDQVAQLNVHTYGTGQRTAVRDIAKGEGKPLWMSEVGGSWSSTGQDFETMESGLGGAQHLVDDLRELEPSAWVFWQPVEDYDNMAPGGESAAGANWGKIHVSFACGVGDTLQTCPIHTNTKYWTTQNFTHHIRPGDRLIGVDDRHSAAAVSASGDAAVVVHVNSGEERAVTLDLSGFAAIDRRATVTPVVTSADGYLVEGEPVAVPRRADRVTLAVPAESVTTFVVDGVSGVAADSALVRDGHLYRLQGVQSGRSLAPDGDGVVIRTDADTDDQRWTLTSLGAPDDEGTHRTRYLLTAADGRVLATEGTDLVLTEAPLAATEAPPSARWILSTTGDGTVTLVGEASKRLVDVGGQATADGSSVGTWLANSNANQRWRLIDETDPPAPPSEVNVALGAATSASFTEPGYSSAGVVNGDRTDKAWSNWVSGTKRDADWIEIDLGGTHDVDRVATHFWKDGAHASWASAVGLEARVDGEWVALHEDVAVDASSAGPAPVVELAGTARADAVRVQLTARADTHMVVSEIEVFELAPTVTATAHAQCRGPWAWVTVEVTNTGDAAASVVMTGEHGTATVPRLRPGGSAERSLRTGVAEIPAGEVRVEADGRGVTAEHGDLTC